MDTGLREGDVGKSFVEKYSDLSEEKIRLSSALASGTLSKREESIAMGRISQIRTILSKMTGKVG